jgi:hypothetical protein
MDRIRSTVCKVVLYLHCAGVSKAEVGLELDELEQAAELTLQEAAQQVHLPGSVESTRQKQDGAGGDGSGDQLLQVCRAIQNKLILSHEDSDDSSDSEEDSDDDSDLSDSDEEEEAAAPSGPGSLGLNSQ